MYLAMQAIAILKTKAQYQRVANTYKLTIRQNSNGLLLVSSKLAILKAMVNSTRLVASASTILLTLTTACSQGEPYRDTSVSPTPPQLTVPRPSAVASKAAPPTPSPTTQPERFQDGLDAGMSAATITQSAQSKDDWNLVISRWQSAIALLKTIPKSSPNYAKAQQKIAEYQRNLAYAQKQSNIPPQAKTVVNPNPPVAQTPSQSSPLTPAAPTARPRPTNSSGISSELALAKHLKRIRAKLYGTYWCPSCNMQKQLFGDEAFSQINYIECDLKGKNARPDLCRIAQISGYPTWEIKGQLYPGMRSLQELAELSGYSGDRNFKN
jgi:hypothetical protein